jgi:hypothetical protein
VIRPTLYPAEIHFALLVFGQRGHMQAQATVDYRATVDGEVRTLRVALTPTTAQRQRRHLWGGTMVMADSVSEQKVVNFLSWFRGKWHEDRYAFEVRDELAFLVDGLPRARGAGIAVDVDPAFKDIMSDQPLRVAMELVAKASGFDGDLGSRWPRVKNSCVTPPPHRLSLHAQACLVAHEYQRTVT